MHPFLKSSADHIVSVIKDILLGMNLKIKNTVKRTVTMAGTKSRVATQLKLLKRKYFVTHC